MPASVGVSDIDEDWTSDAVADLLARYMSLSPEVRVISVMEGRGKLGDDWHAPHHEPTSSEIAAIASRTGARSVALSTLEGAFGDLRLSVRLHDAAGEKIWDRVTRGNALDHVIEEATWALSTLVAEPTRSFDERERARCGTTDAALCAKALMAEEAILGSGLLERLNRLVKDLEREEETRIWLAISRTYSCLEDRDLLSCLDSNGIGIPPPSSTLSPSRKKLWASIGALTKGDRERDEIFCDLIDDPDRLVSGIAATWTVETECPGKKRVICNRTDTFLLRYECMLKTTMYDDPETAWRYYEEFSESDLANPLLTATFSMHPMRRDVELAHRWLQRVRLRTGDSNPLLANSLVRIELARRNPHEAMIWARRSVNPRWREGQALLLAGKLRPGQAALAEGTQEMLHSQEAPAPYVFQVIVRPAVQPMLILEIPQLAGSWGEAPGVDEGTSSLQAAGATELARAIREGVDRSRCDDADLGGPLALEWLYLCEDWKGLLETFVRRQEESYAARASAFLAGDAYMRLGKLDDATRLFESLQSDSISRSTLPASSILALERLGTIAMKEGDDETAQRLFSQMADLWKDADSSIPALTRAREHLARLSGTPPD